VVNVAGKKLLLNEVFADGKALILKKDGSGMSFLAFANQNELPDLNLIAYFERMNTPTPKPISESERNENFHTLLFTLIFILSMILLFLYTK
jgi:hypothetical protein